VSRTSPTFLTMPDIDPAALSRSDSILQPSGTSTVATKSLVASAPAAPKAAKTINTAQRIDLEPLYTSLRTAIGEHWAGYKEAISLFVLGMDNLCLAKPEMVRIVGIGLQTSLSRPSQPKRACKSNRPLCHCRTLHGTLSQSAHLRDLWQCHTRPP